MSKNYTQLNLIQRYQIEALLKAGLRKKVIADQIGVHPSTISRELKRNTALRGRTAGDYVAGNAQRRTDNRHREKAKQVLFSDAFKAHAVTKLTVDKWSPKLISEMGKTSGECPISHEWLYQWIWASKHGNKRGNRKYKTLYKHLKHGRRRRKRGNIKDGRGVIPDRVSIEKRPKIVAKRKRLGDIEVDLMMGKNHKGALLVMTDRASLYTRIVKLSGKSSDEVSAAIIKKLTPSTYTLHTLTFDNDKAFTNHSKIAKALGVDTYFARPYTSQDKGTVENRIGVIRRFLPKKTDLTFKSHQQIKEIERKLNNRPVKKFNYLTPNQVLHQKIALIA
jgi:IS30 family transposase